GDGAGGAGDRQGGRGSGDRGVQGHGQDGGDGGGDVPQAAGRGPGGRQHRGAGAGDQAGGDRAGPGAVEAGVDHPAQEVQGGDLHHQEGGRGAPHTVLQGLPAAVLFPDHRRDGRLHAARRRGD